MSPRATLDIVSLSDLHLDYRANWQVAEAMAYRLIETMREGLPPDFDVYDAAAWSAPWPLSEASLALSSAPVRFPDFTRGDWQREARP